MSIFNPNATPSTPAETPKIMPDSKRYKTVTAAESEAPLSALLGEIGGYPWTVQFYHQVLGPDDPVQPLAISIDPTLQQYHHIVDFEVRVSSPLTPTFNKERQSSSFEGSAFTYPVKLIPHRGDMFIADVGNGNWGLFTLTDVTPRQRTLQTVYEINYTMVSELTERREMDLDRKVVKRSYFQKSYLDFGRDPIVQEDTLVINTTLKSHREQLMDRYARDFIDPETRYLTIPEQNKRSYDHYLTQYIAKVYDTSQHPVWRTANWPTVHQLNTTTVDTLWTVLSKMAPLSEQGLSGRIIQEMDLVDIWALRDKPDFQGLYYSRLERLMAPVNTFKGYTGYELNQQLPIEENLSEGDTDASNDEDVEDDFSDLYEEPEDVGETEEDDPDEETETEDEEDEVVLPETPVPDVIYPVTIDRYYVFSEAFYQSRRNEQSQLEQMTTRMLHREMIPGAELTLMCDRAHLWGDLDRFYYTPVLITIIDYVLRRG